MKVTVLYYSMVDPDSDNVCTLTKITIPAKSQYNILENVFGFIIKGDKLSVPKDYYILIEVTSSKYLRKKGIINIFLDYIQNGIYSDGILYSTLTEEPPELPDLPEEKILRIETIEIEDSLINDTLRANSLTEKELDKKLSKL